ncbi:WYL domain-containing protein [Leifsonia shinshuensis]|uniref:helix-turn-helix transcriptional regulator n=1 Tax=Leifsonia shinshuensis TaxID=150026 RepID=UPI00285A03E1|nr:WYL domain-containing protein [Leifsonia shinshuensis]MDR6970601.1 proteasome accessory factor B [Leifsonia shinshuensis]
MSRSPVSPARVPVEERLFSLVLALLATENGLTKSEILSTVQGYRQRYEPHGDNSSLERQFERDKDDIRELGVPLETVEAPEASGNNQLLRYRIPKGAYDLPSDVSFSPEELTLLGLAAAVWREGSLSGESRRALMKLRSLGVEADDPVVGYAPRLRVREAAFEPFSQALERHVMVQFPYLKPGESASRQRTVAPLALVQHQGRWHLQGIDQDALESRTFLLSRVVGPVKLTSRVFDPEQYRVGGEAFAERALLELERIWESNVAEIEVTAGTDAATRLGKRYGDAVPVGADGEPVRLTVNFSDSNILADQLASFGPEVLVLAPEELREQVLQRLEAVVDAHSGATDSGAAHSGAADEGAATGERADG